MTQKLGYDFRTWPAHSKYEELRLQQEKAKRELVIISPDDSVYSEEKGCCLIQIFKRCLGL